MFYKNVQLKLYGRKNVLIIITLNASGYVSLFKLFIKMINSFRTRLFVSTTVFSLKMFNPK